MFTAVCTHAMLSQGIFDSHRRRRSVLFVASHYAHMMGLPVCVVQVSAFKRALNPMQREEDSQAIAGLLGHWRRFCCLSYMPCRQWHGLSPSLPRFASITTSDESLGCQPVSAGFAVCVA